MNKIKILSWTICFLMPTLLLGEGFGLHFEKDRIGTRWQKKAFSIDVLGNFEIHSDETIETGETTGSKSNTYRINFHAGYKVWSPKNFTLRILAGPEIIFGGRASWGNYPEKLAETHGVKRWPDVSVQYLLHLKPEFVWIGQQFYGGVSANLLQIRPWQDYDTWFQIEIKPQLVLGAFF